MAGRSLRTTRARRRKLDVDRTPSRRPSRRREPLGPWIRSFLAEYLPRDKGLSPNTISSYAQALKGFHEHLSAGKKGRRSPLFTDVTVESVLAFLRELEVKRGNSPSTRNARLAGILSFLEYAFVMGCLNKPDYERLRHMSFKRRTSRLVEYLEVEEINALFAAVDHRTRDGFRDLVMLKLLYNTGARASELAALKVSDLDLKNLRIGITGKGRKRRFCGLWETTAAMIKIYLATERRLPRAGFEDFLFINQRRGHFTRFGIRRMVLKYVRRASKACPALAKKRVTPHTIRHTTGVHLVEAGVDLNTVRALLGHEHMATTEIYARPTLKTKLNALERIAQFDRKLFEAATARRQMPRLEPGIDRWLKSIAN
jgi:site-specific recombinase XerD